MEIQELNKQIRNESTEKIKSKVPEQVSTSWYNEDLLYSGKGKSLFIILATEGCSWALGPSGGCTMCSYINDCTQEPVEASKIVELFKSELEKHADLLFNISIISSALFLIFLTSTIVIFKRLKKLQNKLKENPLMENELEGSELPALT